MGASQICRANCRFDDFCKTLWQRLVELKMPLLMIFGPEDPRPRLRARELLKEKFPQLNLHIANGCKYLVPWDAADEFVRRAVPFLKS